VKLELLATRVAEGNPARVREVVLLFEAAGAHTAQTTEARAKLPEISRSFLSARSADSFPDFPLLVEAILEAEAEGLIAEAAAVRAKLPQLVLSTSINSNLLPKFPESHCTLLS
jgi:hypothetical protein